MMLATTVDDPRLTLGQLARIRWLTLTVRSQLRSPLAFALLPRCKTDSSTVPRPSFVPARIRRSLRCRLTLSLREQQPAAASTTSDSWRLTGEKRLRIDRRRRSFTGRRRPRAVEGEFRSLSSEAEGASWVRVRTASSCFSLPGKRASRRAGRSYRRTVRSESEPNRVPLADKAAELPTRTGSLR
jgi:hypothetical protein